MTQFAERQYQDIIKFLPLLDDSQLNAVHTIVIGMTESKERFVSPLKIRTEEQLWAHIEHSVAQADAGMGEDAEDVIDALTMEFIQ